MVFKYTLVIFTFNLVLCSCQDILFPHGASEGDTFIPSNDDGSSGIVLINTMFPFFDSNHDFLFVNTNGVISFLQEVSQFTPDPFPLDADRRFIAPYWGDVDTNEGGTNSYRELIRTGGNEDLFQRADNIIYDAFIGHDKFVSTWMFIATWDRVGFYGTAAPHIVNTFQVVIITNGRHSFTIHNYGEIMWTTGTASDGDSNTGLGGTPAQAGFNAGDGVRFYSIPGSRTPEIVDIEETTNVGTTGRWVFRVDSAEVEDSGCNTAGSLVLYPIVGSMLGGEVVLIQGPCFNETVDVRCNFEGREVPGTLTSNTTAAIVTPTLFKAGRIHLKISLDGGNIYDFEGIYTMLTPDQVTPGIHRVNGANWYRQQQFTITWDTEIFKDMQNMFDFVDIHLFAYAEYPITNNVSLKDILLIGEKIEYSIGTYTFFPFSAPPYHIVGVLKIVNYTKSDHIGDGVVPALWSDVHSLQWRYHNTFSPTSWCHEWANNEFHDLEFLRETVSCPCTLQQALVDTARFSPHPECNINVNSTDNCWKRPGAVHCVRAIAPSTLGGGQECCYGDQEDILNAFFSDGGGFAHRHHHAGVPTYGFPGKVPFLSNFYHDIQPWEQCCYHSEKNCELYKEVRPSQTCENYVPPNPGGGTGDPHILTLDGTSYSFNGIGEYTLIATNDSSFNLQARMARPSSSETTGFPVTAFNAVAAKCNNSDTVHIQVSERRVLDVWIREEESSTWTRLDFEVAPSWSFNDVFVSGQDLTENGVLVAFSTGVSLQLTATHDVMSILILAPISFKNKTNGLLGTWNDNPYDDFQMPNGTILPPETSTRDLHYKFGQLWEISNTSSLLYYPNGFGHSNFRDPFFTPVFEAPVNPGIDPNELWEVCQGNEWCIFDFQATEDKEIAAASKLTYDKTMAVLNSSSEVVICDPVSAPINGSKQMTRSSVGGVAIFSCSPGFILQGNDTITCLPSGQWNGETPVCVALPPPTTFTSTPPPTTTLPSSTSTPPTTTTTLLSSTNSTPIPSSTHTSTSTASTTPIMPTSTVKTSSVQTSSDTERSTFTTTNSQESTYMTVSVQHTSTGLSSTKQTEKDPETLGSTSSTTTLPDNNPNGTNNKVYIIVAGTTGAVLAVLIMAFVTFIYFSKTHAVKVEPENNQEKIELYEDCSETEA